MDLKLNKFTQVPVARTAAYIAAGRAFESRRRDRLFFDPYAEDFSAGYGEVMLRHFEKFRSFVKFLRLDDSVLDSDPNWGESNPSLALTINSISIRTKFFDEMTLKDPTTQVVILAVGYDTRGLRLPFSSDVTVYELDFPEVIEHREKVFQEKPVYFKKANDPSLSDSHLDPSVLRLTLRSNEMFQAPSADAPDQPASKTPDEAWKNFAKIAEETLNSCKAKRVPVPSDLREVDVWTNSLLSAGFDPKVPSVWLIEGLSMYLTEPQYANLMFAVAGLTAPNSRVITDLMTPYLLDSPAIKPFLDDWAEWGAPLIFGSSEPYKLLKSFGWVTDRLTTYGADDTSYRTAPSFIQDIMSKIHHKNPSKNYMCSAVRNSQTVDELKTAYELSIRVDAAKAEIETLKQWIVSEKLSKVEALIHFLENRNEQEILQDSADSILNDID